MKTEGKGGWENEKSTRADECEATSARQDNEGGRRAPRI